MDTNKNIKKATTGERDGVFSGSFQKVFFLKADSVSAGD
jgi:hypothetical protein